MPLIRLDQWLVDQGYFASLQLSQRALRAGQVRDRKSGDVLDKIGMRVPKGLQIVIEKPKDFVSRGGLKLAGFLKDSQISFQDKVVLDVGSSTGGFTDCALQAGAKKIYCIDVGTHQLHEKIRFDPRVEVHEETDIRNFPISSLKPLPEIVLVDVSFISLKAVVSSLIRALPKATFIFLFKPQFEVDRHSPKKRGVADPKEAAGTLQEMLLFLQSLGLNARMVLPSALKGTKGNQETFILADLSNSAPIFRTYDIRGLADRDLPDELVFRLGISFAERLLEKNPKAKNIGVGRDARASSPRLFSALVAGILEKKLKVHDLGEVTTPLVYFAHYKMDLDAVIQITASHNPKDDNGMKMMALKETLFGDEIQILGSRSLQRQEIYKSSSSKPPSVAEDLRAQYLKFLTEHFRIQRKWKIAVDCGNGMAGMIARDAFSPHASGLDVIYENVDCRFPNHEADPTIPENLKDLQKLMKKKKFDVGFAFDGDADRLGVITPKGRILYGDEILLLLSEKVLKENPGSMIIGEVKCSEKLFRGIQHLGGVPLMYRTGHSLIKKKMKEAKAPLAGEMSGHLFFADRYFGFDDAVYGALRVLEVMDQFHPDLDAWVERLPPSFVTPEIRVPCEESEKMDLVKRAQKFFQTLPETQTTEIDGVRVTFADGAWALVRASNTQAVLVVRVEAPSENRKKEVLDLVRKALGREIT